MARIMRPRGGGTTPLTNYTAPQPLPVTENLVTKHSYVKDEVRTPTQTTPTTPVTTTPPITNSKFNPAFQSYDASNVNQDPTTNTTPPVVTAPVVGDVSSTPLPQPYMSNVDDVKRALSILRGQDQMDYLNLVAVMEQNNGQLPSQQQRMRWDALQRIIYPNYGQQTPPVQPRQPIQPGADAATMNPNDADPFGWKKWADAYGDARPVDWGTWLKRQPGYSPTMVMQMRMQNPAAFEELRQKYNMYRGVFTNPYTGKLNPFGGRKRFFNFTQPDVK